MAEHRLSTQILLRYDTYTRWMGSDVILQQGETAIAAFPDTNPNNPPKAIGIKVGDGTHYFDELPWIQAMAADVYEWAKDPTKPVYTANEISGLAEYIAAHTSGGGGGGGSESSSAYQIIYDSASDKYILQQWNDTTGEWENTASEINLHDILNRIDTIERWANGARTKLGNIEAPLQSYVYEEVVNELNKIDVYDEAVSGQYVTSVVQLDGRISVSRAPINMSEIEQGVLPTKYGGTGLTTVDEEEVLVGSQEGTITTKPFVTTIEREERNAFATTGAIINYVAQETADLNRAMHFIGETSVVISSNSRANPQIPNYDFTHAQPGDIILANNTQEYIWTGSYWRLLGDEGSYAVKGNIVNADIADNANIAQSKIDGLEEILDTKVDKVEGKQLSTNDYTTEEKTKLSEIENGAQVNLIEHILVNDTETLPNSEKTINLQIPVLTEEQIAAIDAAQPNVIEHIFVNGTEVPPTTISNQPKSVGINFIPYSQEEKDKLNAIESEAQVNKIETIVINGNEFTPNNEKTVEITIDQAALDLDVLTGARYPKDGGGYEDIDIDSTSKKLELSHVAATGNINNLIQTTGTYVILNCGSSTEVI